MCRVRYQRKEEGYHSHTHGIGPALQMQGTDSSVHGVEYDRGGAGETEAEEKAEAAKGP